MSDGVDSIKELCRRAKITDYLEERGVRLIRAGRRIKCCCPIPGHKDDTPSFNITETPDGRQVFKCFGCDVWGDIVDLMHLIESKSKGDIIRGLSKTHGVELGKFESSYKAMITPEEVLSSFCYEEDRAKMVCMYARMMLQMRQGSTDAVDKVSLAYQRVDELLELGDYDGLNDVLNTLKSLINKYEV